MWALVPIKNLDSAKRRLAGSLPESSRRRVAEVMLEDVLRALLGALQIEGGAVISGDPAVHAIARRYAFEALDEPAGAQAVASPDHDPEAALNAALEHARNTLQRRGVKALLVLPGDVPLVHPGEIDELALRAAATERAVVLAPDRWQRGTNALVIKPLSLLSFRFGPDSAEAHRVEAAQAEAPFASVELPGLALDVDTAEDLKQLLAQPGSTLTQQLLAANLPQGLRSPSAAAREGVTT